MREVAASAALLCVVACGKPSRPLPALSTVPDLQTRLSPDEAYEAIPHRRTVISLDSTSLSDSERLYVRLVFACLDQGIALRVTTVEDFLTGDRDLDSYTSDQDRLIAFLGSIDPPEAFGSYHQKIRQAFADQRAFFVAWRDAGSLDIRSHPKVQSSSEALHVAFDLIMRAVADRAPGNDEALFDYHCALDFV